MQLSASVPCGPRAIAEYLAHGEPLRMNVSKEADRAFRFELKKADPKRWAALDAELHKDFYRRQRRQMPSIAEITAEVAAHELQAMGTA